MLQRATTTSSAVRLPLIDALRAGAAQFITWHHFMIYGPLVEWSMPSPGLLLDVVKEFRWAAQVFFVLGGYMMARGMTRRRWDGRQVDEFVIRRYCRLGLPYLAAIALALGACAIGRGWLSEDMIGPPPTWQQVLAHVFLLQDILGYESLSTGFWFVCVDFQLGVLFVSLLWLRDAWARWRGTAEDAPAATVPMLASWTLAACSMFYFNLDDDLEVWAIYFFGQYFLGAMVYYGLKSPRGAKWFGLYVTLMAAALLYDWRWRLATALITGIVLFLGGKLGIMERWPASRLVGYLGRTSYGLFLIHFPVLIVVSTVWVRMDWATQGMAIAGLIVAYVASLAVAHVFHRAIELPAARLSRKFA